MAATRTLATRTAFLLLALAVPVHPCGGPEHYDIEAPLASADEFLQAVEVIDDFDYRPRAALRFLYPFVVSGAPQASAHWRHAYGLHDVDTPVQVDTTARFSLDAEVSAFARAGERGNARELARAARALVEAALDVPAVVADDYQPAIRRAVEALEVLAAPATAGALTPALVQRLYGITPPAAAKDAPLFPSWAGEVLSLRTMPRDSLPAWGEAHPQSPRLGSLRFVGLQLAMKRGIPDGWANETRDSVPPARWRELGALHDTWRARFSGHPLAGWVEASRIRLAYFAGDTASAWDAALSLYATHRPRALEEMRFLLRQSFDPPTLDDARIDPPLRAALLGEVGIDGPRWRREWERVARLTTPWAAATRDRLMWHAAHDSAGALRLPAASLAVPASSLSPVGRALRLVALIRGGRTAEAIAQADSLGDDSTVAPMKVQLLLAAHRWRDALAAPGISGASRQYLVRVLAPDSVLSALAAGSDAALAREARRTTTIRAAVAGDWGGAANRLGRGEAQRAALWRRAHSLAADTSLGGRLAFARYLRAQNGRLFWGNDKVWYRSLNWRFEAVTGKTTHRFNPILPWSADDEARAIGRHFRDGFEMYHAVRAYADFLARAPRSDARRTAALREANLAYNWLVNWDSTNSRFWGDALEAEGIGRVIRQAGRR